MFRRFGRQNYTSLYTQLRYFVDGAVRKRNDCCKPVDYDKYQMGDCNECQTENKEPPVQVTICGANGQVGQIISFLLKQSPLVNILSLYDLDCTYGISMDLAHIDTSCRVQSFSGCKDLYEAMCGSQIVVICAGVGRAPGMSLNDLFVYNAPVVKQLAEAIAEVNPNALVAILTNPINSFVPMVSQIFKKAGNYDGRKIFGITNIDSMRACSIVTNDIISGEDPGEYLVPVIGGHSPETMIPVLSQTSPCVELPNTSFDYLIEKIRGAACLITSLKHRGGPRLSVALGVNRFVNNLIRGLKDEKNVLEIAFVYTTSIPGTCYFSTPIELGPEGIKQQLGLLKLDADLEKCYFKEAIKCLREDVKRGETYITPPSDTSPSKVFS